MRYVGIVGRCVFGIEHRTLRYESGSRPNTGEIRSSDTEVIRRLGCAGSESVDELRFVHRRADFWMVESIRVAVREGAVDAMANRRKSSPQGGRWYRSHSISKP